MKKSHITYSRENLHEVFHALIRHSNDLIAAFHDEIGSEDLSFANLTPSAIV